MIDQIFVGIANFSYTFAFDAAVNFKILIRLNRGIQSATEISPLKGSGVLQIVLTASPRLSICVLLAHLF